EPGWAEGVFGAQPARREDHEVQVRSARCVAGRSEYGEDRGIGMVETDRPDRVEATQVVTIRNVVAVPGDDIQRRVADGSAPQRALELGDQLEVAFEVFIGRDRRF